MPKVIGSAQVEYESIELNGYTTTVRWNNPYPWGHDFWLTGETTRETVSSRLEIGLNTQSHVLEVLKIVTVSKPIVSLSDWTDYSHLPNIQGLPVLLWSYDRPAPQYIRHQGRFYLSIGTDQITITIGNNAHVVRALSTDHAVFGIDVNDELRIIQITNLQPEQIETIKQAHYYRM